VHVAIASWFIVLVAGLASLYPLFDLLVPGAAIRVQIRATERRAGWQQGVGVHFQR